MNQDEGHLLAKELAKSDMKIPRDATYPSLTRPESFDVYARAYWMAANKLFDTYWGDDEMAPTPDYLVMPVLYLVYHFVELELKEIIRLSYWVGTCEGINLIPLPTTPNHKLTNLLNKADQNLQQIVPKEGPLLDSALKDLIVDLEKFGGTGEALRYPEGISKKAGEPTLSDHYVADVRAVMEVTKKIEARFSGAIGLLYNALESYPY